MPVSKKRRKVAERERSYRHHVQESGKEIRKELRKVKAAIRRAKKERASE